MTPTTPTSLTQSFTSINSEFDINAILAEMTVKMPVDFAGGDAMAPAAVITKRHSSVTANGDESTDSGVVTSNGNC